MRTLSGKTLVTALLLVVFVLTGCSGGSKATPAQPAQPAAPTQAPGMAETKAAEYTQAVETIAAELTRNAPAAPAVPPAHTMAAGEQMLPSPTPTEEPLPPTSTSLPTNAPLPSDTPVPTNTPLPTNTQAPSVPPSATYPLEPNWILSYQTDLHSEERFKSNKSDDFHYHFTLGGFVMFNKVAQDIVYSVISPAAGGVRLEVSGQHVSGPLDGYYGLICNFADGRNYYFLGVGSDGWYGIGVRKENKMSWLKEGHDTMQVYTGAATNNLRADCYRGTLNLWVNGNLLATVKDTTYSGGWVGLGVGNRLTTGAEVLFNNFFTYVPAQP